MLPCCFLRVSGGVVQGVPAHFDVKLGMLEDSEDKSVLGIWKRNMSSRAVYDTLAVGRNMSFILVIEKKISKWTLTISTLFNR